ncbi:carbohydrate phosphatase [Thermothelomyces heterothallicus CBS 203.75]
MNERRTTATKNSGLSAPNGTVPRGPSHAGGAGAGGGRGGAPAGGNKGGVITAGAGRGGSGVAPGGSGGGGGGGGVSGRPRPNDATGNSKEPRGVTALGAGHSDKEHHSTAGQPPRNNNATSTGDSKRSGSSVSGATPATVLAQRNKGNNSPPAKKEPDLARLQNLPATKRPDYARERRIAELLAQRASVVTETVLAMLNLGYTQGPGPTSSSAAAPISQYKPPTGGGRGDGAVKAKTDMSPVTIADYAAQALLMWALKKAFPNDLLLGEEDAEELMRNGEMLTKVCDVINKARRKVEEEWKREKEEWARKGNRAEDFQQADKDLPWPTTEDEVLGALKSGVPKVFGIKDGKKKERDVELENGKRYWIMDPVDGTSAFMSNGQYAILLALVKDGEGILGVCACPNTGYDEAVKGERVREYMVVPGRKKEAGLMLAAVKGHGATMRKLGHTDLLGGIRLDWSSHPPLSLTEDSNGHPDFSSLTFIDSERSPKSRSDVVKALAGKNYRNGVQGYSSHWRYAVGAVLGPGVVQVRCPINDKRDWKIWDHVGTIVIYEESGAGKVTDMYGKPLDYSHSPAMTKNWGVIAAHRSIHEHVRRAAWHELNLIKQA